MDLFTVGSVLMDEDLLRKQLYGKRGAFRPKPYGVEYRSLSNFWVQKPEYIGWAWDATARAMDAWQENVLDIDSLDEPLYEAINNNNRAIAQDLVNAYQLPYVNA
jgi:hypothetical protein